MTEAPISNRDRDRVVRVTAASLTRLMGLAGEALVQTHRLPPLVESLWRLKGRQTDSWNCCRSWKIAFRARASRFPRLSANCWAGPKHKLPRICSV